MGSFLGDVRSTLYERRFELFLFALLSVLFGSLFFRGEIYDLYIGPALFLINIALGINLLSGSRKLVLFFVVLFASALLFYGTTLIAGHPDGPIRYIRMGIYFFFYAVITVSLIKQIWRAERVTRKVIAGLMSGYVCLGLMGFFIFMSIELMDPGSFQGSLLAGADLPTKIDSLLYYSFITLLTVGYGEIIPATAIAQKAAILVGLTGQFYIVILTGIIVGKFLRHSEERAATTGD